jgi:hypothetical protein
MDIAYPAAEIDHSQTVSEKLPIFAELNRLVTKMLPSTKIGIILIEFVVSAFIPYEE